MAPTVKEILDNDRWTAVEGHNGSSPFIIRYRAPVRICGTMHDYDQLLTVVWPYADENTGALPTPDDSAQMAEFEDRFCEAVESDALAILTAVLTFDGARQWVYYTGDVAECGGRLNRMPQNADPYPIELTTEVDPEWKYLRERILARVPDDG